MSVKGHHKTIGFFTIWLFASFLGSALLLLNIGIELEYRTWDWRAFFVAKKSPPDPKIKIITIDQSSLDHYAKEEYETWPWHRQYYGAVVEYLKLAKAKGAAFDIIYSEPSSRGVDDDNEFVSSFDDSVPIISAVPFKKKESEIDETRLELLKNRLKNANIEIPQKGIAKFQSLILPITQLIEKSAGFGNVTADPDSDGIYRRIKLAGQAFNLTIPALPLALFLKVGNKLPSSISDRFTKDGSLIINFRGGSNLVPDSAKESPYETFSIASIIASFARIRDGEEPIIPLDTFKDSYVLIGMTAPGLFDLRPSPLSATFPGVAINATILDNLLHNDFIKLISKPLSLLIILIFTAAVSAPIFILKKPLLETVVVGIIFFLYILLLYFGALEGYWLPCISPIFSMTIAILGSLGVQYRFEGMQHKFIKDAFKYYVSPEVIDRIIDDPSKLSLGGERRELTIFFSDLAGFTTISEKMDPHKLSNMLNEFLTAMTDIILDTGGTLDKYEGDAIIAFWNAPLDIADHAGQGVNAALLCQAKLKEMNSYFYETYGVHLHMRVGLNTGEVSVGNFGSRERFNYTIIGDAANLASRLEGVNKVFGTSILFSESTLKKLQSDIHYRKIANVQVVGKVQSIPVFEPVSFGTDISSHEKAMSLFEAGNLTAALEIFKELPFEPLYEKYIARIEDELKVELKSFAPIWKLESK